MKFAFLIMGNFDMKMDRATIHGGDVQMIGVSDMQEAVAVAKQLREEGIECIELCGAFGAEGAKRIIEITENRIPVGYVTHLPEQDEIYKAVFSK